MKQTLIYLAALLIAFGLGYWSKPVPSSAAKKTDTETKKDVQTKTVKQTVIKERPDGSKVTQIVEKTDSSSIEETDTETKETVNYKRNWSAGLYVQAWPQETPAFIGTLDRRIFENVSVGLYVHYKPSDFEAGLGLRVDF